MKHMCRYVYDIYIHIYIKLYMGMYVFVGEMNAGDEKDEKIEYCFGRKRRILQR